MADDDQYALCWNNFNKNLTAGFHSLYSRGHFTDVTLSAGGQLLKAHRMVLSVCSPYFQAMFESTPVTQHPIIFLKDITFKNLTDLVQFMYCGEVHVKQDELSGFIAIAESLQIKGLTESGESSSSPDNSKHDTSASSRPLRAAKRTRKRELEDIISTPLKVGKRTSTTALRQGKKLSTHSQDPLQQDTPIPSTSTAEFIEMDALQTKTEPASFDDQDMDSSYMQADDTFNASELVEKDDNYEHSYSEADDAHEEKESRDEINNTDTGGTKKLLYRERFATVIERKPAATSAENTDFEKCIMKELRILNLKMDDLSENMNILLNNKPEVANNPELNEVPVPDITRLLPVNENSLTELENWLMTSEQNKTALSQNLSRNGGRSVKEIVRRIMYHVFTNEVGMYYSWEGAKKKKVFKNLALTSCIFSAIRLNGNAKDCTDSEIITLIKAWLVRSKDRFINNYKKLNNEYNPEIPTIEAVQQPRNDTENTN